MSASETDRLQAVSCLCGISLPLGCRKLAAAETRRTGASEQLIGVAKQEASVDAELLRLQNAPEVDKPPERMDLSGRLASAGRFLLASAGHTPSADNCFDGRISLHLSEHSVEGNVPADVELRGAALLALSR